MIRVVLADDHHVVRAGIRALLESEPGIEVVGEDSDGLTVESLTTSLAPDVLVLDVALPGLGGLEVLRRVKRSAPRVRVIVLTMHADDGYVATALRAGANGYVLKSSPPGELIHAVRAVMRDERYLAPPLSAQSVADWTRRIADAARDPLDTLTAREREALHLAAEGLSNPEIARRLGIAVRTAEAHRANVLRKLGLRNQAELVRFAVERALLARDPGPAPRSHPAP